MEGHSTELTTEELLHLQQEQLKKLADDMLSDDVEEMEETLCCILREMSVR